MGRKGGGAVDWPTGVHQEGVYTRWNGCHLVRGLVGQDKKLFHVVPMDHEVGFGTASMLLILMFITGTK